MKRGAHNTSAAAGDESEGGSRRGTVAGSPDDPPDYAEIDRWLDRLLDLPSAEAQRVLQECDDPAVRAELDSLLGVAPVAGGDDAFELGLGKVAGELLQEAGEDPAEQLREGRRLGRYELLEILGRGGMGVVWRARRADGEFEQEVAIKLLPQGLETASAEARFARERQILARLEHPGIARLIDGGVSDDGTPYLVMELVRGEAIDQWVRQQRCDARQIVDLMIQVCDAVAFAHRRMVVHRDLKPSNLLVEEHNGRHAAVRLLDFGVAKLLDDADRSLTGTSLAAPLTLNYAAPEQIRGEQVSASTDVYTLGVLLFQLLVGRVPHDRATLTLSEAIEESTRDTTLPPSEALRRSGLGASPRIGMVSGDLDLVVLKALRTDPAQRYVDVGELRDDLEAVLHSRPISARPLTLTYRAGRFARRNRWPLAAAGAVLLALLLGLLGTTWQARRAGAEARRAERTVDFLESMLLDANPSESSLEQPTVVDLLERGVERIDEELADAPRVRARVRHLVGRAFDGLGEKERSSQLNTVALAEAEEAFGPRSNEVAWILVALARHEALGEQSENERRLEDALKIILENEGPESFNALQMHTQVGHVLRFDPQRAEKHYRRAFEIAQATLEPEDAWQATVRGNLGMAVARLGRTAEGIEALEQALQIFDADSLGGQSDALAVRNNLATLYHNEGLLEQAESAYREVVVAREARLESQHPLLGRSYSNLGRLLMDRARFVEALEPIERAHSIAASQREDDLGRVAAEINLASVRFELGEFEEALEGYERALAVFRETLGSDHPYSRRVALLLGRTHLVAGRLAAAEPLLNVPKTLSDQSIPAINRIRGQLDLARLRRLQGRLEEAGDVLRAATADQEQGSILEGWEADELVVETGLQAMATDGVVPDEALEAARRLAERMPAGNWRLGDCLVLSG